MKCYIEGALIQNEKLEYVGKLSIWPLMPSILLGGLIQLVVIGSIIAWGSQFLDFLNSNKNSRAGSNILVWLCLVVFLVGLVFWFVAYIRYRSTEVAITNKRVIAKFGLISRHTIEIYIRKIESIQVNQDIRGRIFNYGSLVISGAGNPQAPIPGISDPLKFRRIFMELQDKQELHTQST